MMSLIVAFLLSGAFAQLPPKSPYAGLEKMNGISLKDYRGFDKKWKLVTVRYRKDTGEMRFVYANPLAEKTLMSGKTDYPDGAVFAKVEFQPLKGPKQKHKGSRDNGTLSPTLAHDESDAGQTLLRTASDDGTSKLYAFMVTYPTGAKRYFQGRVFGYPETTDGADTILTAAPTIEISTDIVKVAAA